MAGAQEREIIEAHDRAAWRAWLGAHHAQPVGIWLVLPRKSSTAAGVAYDDAVEEAFCFGWIDSTSGTLDEHRSLLDFAPRKRGSPWARSNKNASNGSRTGRSDRTAGPGGDRPRPGRRFLECLGPPGGGPCLR